MTTFDPRELEAKVKAMYRAVAETPQANFHFEMGRELAERLGYSPADLDQIPAAAVESFAGVGFYFHLAVQKGETVVDFGSGSGMDTFIAALRVGDAGSVFGVDMTDEQLAKAERLRVRDGFQKVKFVKGYIDNVPLPDGVADVVISNGVINLAVDKPAVFREAARVLRPGGRLAIADIVTNVQLPDGITCNSTLWAACIGGAMQKDDFRASIEAAGLLVERMESNERYEFISESARGASRKYGVHSVTLLAVKPLLNARAWLSPRCGEVHLASRTP